MSRSSRTRSDREVAKAFALQLPDVELSSHHGTMDIRVRNSIFATFPAQQKVVLLRCTPAELERMTKQNSQAFTKVRGESWVQVALDEIDRATLETLLIDAWLLAAPAALRRVHEARLSSKR